MYKPIQLTDEEIDELLRDIKVDYATPSNYTSGYEYWNNYDDWDAEGYSGSNSSKRKHDWTPILLSFMTVYNCAHCDIAKEKATSEYCDEEN